MVLSFEYLCFSKLDIYNRKSLIFDATYQLSTLDVIISTKQLFIANVILFVFPTV